jgi:aryl-alcohol dehydrogenase-like predicted oxidoreductase
LDDGDIGCGAGLIARALRERTGGRGEPIVATKGGLRRPQLHAPDPKVPWVDAREHRTGWVYASRRNVRNANDRLAFTRYCV